MTASWSSTEHRITTPHGTVAAVDYRGDGPNILLLHGGGRTLADWELVRPLLRERRVVAADLRWHGFSSDEGDVSLEANADDIEAIIDALGLDNPAVIGHSLGGMVAAVYATRHPECPGVANLDGHGMGTPDQYDGISAEQLEAFRKPTDEPERSRDPRGTSGDDAWHDAFVSEITTEIGGAWGLDPEVADAVASRSFLRADDGTWNLRPNEEHLALLLPMLESVRLFDIYRAVECSLLIYRCTRFPPMPIPDAEADDVMSAYQRGLARDLTALEAERPNVRVRTLDATHMMIFEVPAEVAGDILSLTA
jgi:pimeloyl-ACP methyl ester carboxylesterase